MSNVWSRLGWILFLVIILVGLFIGRHLQKLFKENETKIAEQQQIMRDLEHKNRQVRAYSDSLDQVLLGLYHQQDSLAIAHKKLQFNLIRVRQELHDARARLETAWETGDVLHEMDKAFPTWQGQFHAATRGDGIHGIIAPQFFGMQAVELQTKWQSSESIIKNKDSTIANLEQQEQLKKKEIAVWTLKSDSLQKTYNNLWQEYNAVDKNYQKCLKRKWCSINLSMDNLVAAGIGLAGGYAIWGGKKK